MSGATISKTAMDCYRIQTRGEWATICIAEWSRPRGDGTSQQLGEILVYSSFGSFNNQWSACGARFRKFLLGLDRDYFMEKCIGERADVFDGEGSVNELLGQIIEERRRRSLDKVEARDLVDAINDVREQAERSKEGFINAICGIDFHSMNHSHSRGTPWSRDRFNCIREQFLAEPWCMTRDKPNPQTVGFWETIWPVFCDTIREELAAEPVAA